MDKDASLFSSLSEFAEKNTFTADDCALIVSGCGDIKCQYGTISNVYHVHNLSENRLLISQLAQNGKSVEFSLD